MRLSVTATLLVASVALHAQWAPINSGVGYKLESFSFVDANTGMCTGSSGVIKTTDGGANWSSSLGGAVRDVHMVDANTAYLAGVVSQACWGTTDGGNNWTQFTPPVGNSLWGVSAPSATTVYWSGTAGTVFKSTNGGTTITSVDPAPTGTMSDIYFTSTTEGYVCSQMGDIWQTTTAGAGWSVVHNEFGVLFTDIGFLDANNGFACGSNGTVVKTTDGGNNWTSLNTGTTSYLQYVDFFDANNGIAVGYGPTVIHTSDGGTTWTLDTVGIVEDLFSCHMFSGTHAIVGGDNGAMYENTNLTTGMEQPRTSNRLEAFPNPTAGPVNVMGVPVGSAVQVLDRYGRPVLNTFDHQITLANLPNGIYLVRAGGSVSKVVLAR